MSNTPHHLGKYELQDLLGRGGMAEVWKAFDVQLRRHVAIKLLHADLQADPDFISRFTHEAQVVAALRHPNIVQIYDFHTSEQQGSDNATAYMVMEYIQGKTLAHYIHTTSHKKNIPSASEVVRLFTPISLALDYAHRHGTVHRDIKPANILLDQTQRMRHPMGEPILSDFGLAKFLNTTSHTMGIFGTPLYMAPEQAQNKPITARTDLYALGVIYYEILTGVPPFQGDTLIGILMRHVNDELPDPRTLNAQLPEGVVLFLRKALAKKPQDRYESASSMTVALAQAFGLVAPEDLVRNSTELGEGGMTVYTEGLASSFGESGSRVSVAESAEDEEDDPFSITIVRSGANSNPGLLLPESEPPRVPVVDARLIDAQTLHDMAAEQTMRSEFPSGFEGKPGEDSAQVDGGRGVDRPLRPVINPVTPLPPVFEEPGRMEEILRLATRRPVEPQERATMVMVSPPAPSAARRGGFWRRYRVAAISMIVLVCVLVGAGLGTFLVLARRSQVPVASTIVGQASFESSGQTNINSSQGINDEININLHGIPNPPEGKKYYAWLLEDKSQSEGNVTLLGEVRVKQGNVQQLYQGGDQHTNLLAKNSQFLITEEDASVTPIIPTTDVSMQLYSAAIPQTKAEGQQFSLLDHLRHLLAADPTLLKHHLQGGLNIWLQRNTQSVQNLAGVARDDWNTKNYDAVHAQIVTMLDYLDGSGYVGRDVPAHTALLADAKSAQIGLLNISENENPQPYLIHIAVHLNGVLKAPGVTALQRNLAVQITVGLNFVTMSLAQVRHDALQLVRMSDGQMAQPAALALLNDLVTNANNAYEGRTNPATNAQQQGVAQIYLNIQRMATFIVQANTRATK